MEKCSFPFVYRTSPMGRALPKCPTNCPTRVLYPDSVTSNQDGYLPEGSCIVRSHRPIIGGVGPSFCACTTPAPTMTQETSNIVGRTAFTICLRSAKCAKITTHHSLFYQSSLSEVL